jgi:hypothetical protein
MKITINHEPRFEPIELKIIIEDLDDIKILFGMFNNSNLEVKEKSNKLGYIKKDFNTLELWNPINSLAKKYNLV